MNVCDKVSAVIMGLRQLLVDFYEKITHEIPIYNGSDCRQNYNSILCCNFDNIFSSNHLWLIVCKQKPAVYAFVYMHHCIESKVYGLLWNEAQTIRIKR